MNSGIALVGKKKDLESPKSGIHYIYIYINMYMYMYVIRKYHRTVNVHGNTCA